MLAGGRGGGTQFRRLDRNSGTPSVYTKLRLLFTIFNMILYVQKSIILRLKAIFCQGINLLEVVGFKKSFAMSVGAKSLTVFDKLSNHRKPNF